MLGRDLRLFVRELPAALVIAVLLGVFCALAATSLLHGTDRDYTAASIAVVDEDNTFASSLAITMISRQDFAAPLAISKASAQEAEQGLKDGTFMAVLYLPSGYSSQVLTGEQSSAKLVLSDSVPLQSDVVRLLCSFGEELLYTGQLGVFAGEELVMDIAPDRHTAYLTKANAKFLAQALADPKISRQTISYALTGVPAQNWYGVLYAMAFFQLLSLSFLSLGRDCRSSMLRRLAAEGIGNREFLIGKWGILFVLNVILTSVFLAFLHTKIYVFGFLAALIALAMSAAVSLALLLCLNRGHAVTVVTALTAVSLFASGGIVPRMELPQRVNTIGDLFPLGAGARLAASLFSGKISFPHLFACLGWILLSVGILYIRLYIARKGAEQ